MTRTSRRLSRPKPERTGPIRDFSGLLKRPERGDDRPASAASQDGSERVGAHADAVSESVRLGYAVIQEQIRQGRRIAEQFSGGARALGASDGLAHLFQRMLNYSIDLGALFADMMEVTTGMATAADRRAAPFANGRPGGKDRSDGRGAAAISVEIEASRPIKVTLDLRPRGNGSALAVPGLFALNGDSVPLTGIAFTAIGDGAAPALRIKVPQTQTPGTYTGAVVDAETNEPCGTLSVRLAE